jgi:cytochrome c-type biogenesis protein
VTLSLLRGLVAAVNPCGFVLLPTYLMYFLGAEASSAVAGVGERRSTVRRALTVSAALTAGFMSVFIFVGLVTYNFTSWIQQNARYATGAIAVALIALAVAMLTGRSVAIRTPHFDVGGRDRTIRSMYLFGVAYAIASLGCTIGLFLPTIFSIRGDGFVYAVASVAAYGIGMGLLVTALTVSLAVAQVGLLTLLRRSMRYVERIAAIFILISGVYLAYYFWVVDVRGSNDPITAAVERVQQSIITSLNNHWRSVVVVLGAIIAVAFALSRDARAAHDDAADG